MLWLEDQFHGQIHRYSHRNVPEHRFCREIKNIFMLRIRILRFAHFSWRPQRITYLCFSKVSKSVLKSRTSFYLCTVQCKNRGRSRDKLLLLYSSCISRQAGAPVRKTDVQPTAACIRKNRQNKQQINQSQLLHEAISKQNVLATAPLLQELQNELRSAIAE